MRRRYSKKGGKKKRKNIKKVFLFHPIFPVPKILVFFTPEARQEKKSICGGKKKLGEKKLDVLFLKIIFTIIIIIINKKNHRHDQEREKGRNACPLMEN